MIQEVQKHLARLGIDGWLVYDFRKSNELAHRALKIPTNHTVTRRFFYWIPQKGDPIQLVHVIEPGTLSHLPGEKRIYRSWEELEKELRSILKKKEKVAMEYSYFNRLPYVSRVDAGTVDFIRSLGVEVISSEDFLLYFTSVLSQKEMESQVRAASALNEIVEKMWQEIVLYLNKGKPITEYDVQEKILKEFEKRALITDHPPIVAVNAHSADPHFEPSKSCSSEIKRGDFLLIDLWAKEENGVFGDITKVAVLAKAPTKKQKQVFDVVKAAQFRALELIEKRLKEKTRIEGWEVDAAARDVIEKSGFGKFFIHKTGHSIETTLHGSGTHLDSLEVKDTRPLIENTCFSIEPGIYLPGEFGVRLEFDVLVYEGGKLQVTGGRQEEICALFPAL